MHCEDEGRGLVWRSSFVSPLFPDALSITHHGFKQHERAITEQFNLSCFCVHTLSACDATVEVAVTANSQSSLSANSAQMITFGPPSDKVISPSLLSGAWGTAEACDNLINRSCVDMGHLLWPGTVAWIAAFIIWDSRQYILILWYYCWQTQSDPSSPTEQRERREERGSDRRWVREVRRE